jgi:hypothetical protein
MAAALWIYFVVSMAISMPIAFVIGGSGLVAPLMEGQVGKELVADLFIAIAAKR